MAGKTKGLLPGLTGGIIGAVLTATIAFPILLDQEQQVADTPLSNGMPKQVSTTSNDPVTNAVATAQKSVVTVTNYQTGNAMSQKEAAAGSGSGVIYKKRMEKHTSLRTTTSSMARQNLMSHLTTVKHFKPNYSVVTKRMT